ncbi:conserved hypothetical protein [delta proteobacterium NaphS2]|nr:conserved hypothetical protein [delta proteobacterium NaphS2]
MESDNRTNVFQIKIFDDIDNDELVSNWRRIEKAYDYFPQSRYGWCAPWWKTFGGKRVLHVITAIDQNKKIVGIAPCCIERAFGCKLLRSFPIHFGDFYTFIVENESYYEDIVNVVIEYMKSFSGWNAVKLDQVNQEDRIHGLLINMRFGKKEMTQIITARFENNSINEFISKLSKNTRKKIKNKKKRLNNDYILTVHEYDNYKGYLEIFHDLRMIYKKRWSRDMREMQYQCRNKALNNCFGQKKVIIFVLKANDKIIAFLIGFLHKLTFYAWKISHDPDFNQYSPGFLMIYYTMQTLMAKNIFRMNFMGGGHEHDKVWAKDGFITMNYFMLFSDGSLRGKFLRNYFLQWRDILTHFYYRISHTKPFYEKLRFLTFSTQVWNMKSLAPLKDFVEKKVILRIRQFGWRTSVIQGLKSVIRPIYQNDTDLIFICPKRPEIPKESYREVQLLTLEKLEERKTAWGLLRIDEQRLRNFLNQGCMGFLIEKGEQLAGYAFIQTSGTYPFGKNGQFIVPDKVAVFKNQFVFPAFRGQRLTFQLNAARSSSIPTEKVPIVFVLPENKYAIRSLKKRGFFATLKVVRSIWFKRHTKQRIYVIKENDLNQVMIGGFEPDKNRRTDLRQNG